MKKPVILFFLLFTLFLSALSLNSYGQPDHCVNFFLCKQYIDLPERDQAYYVAGMSDMLSYMMGKHSPFAYLLFENKIKEQNLGQIKKVFDEYIKNNPYLANCGASSIFYFAITEAYLEDSIKELEDFSKTFDEEYISDFIKGHDKEYFEELSDIIKRYSSIDYFEDYLKELVNDLEHDDHAVRWQAIIELEELGTSASSIIPDLIKYLEHDDWYVRYYSVEILGFVGLGDESVIQAVKKVSFSDSNEKVREKAEWVFSELSGSK